jgi:ribosome-associated protein
MDGGELAKLSARACAEFKAEDIRILDVRKVTDDTEYLVIATLDTRVQMKGVLGQLQKSAKSLGEKKPGIEGTESYRWVLIDFFDCIVHLLDPEARDFYELESLWGEAVDVDWER